MEKPNDSDERLEMELNVSRNYYSRNQKLVSPNLVHFSSHQLINEQSNKFVEEDKVAGDEVAEKIMSVYSTTSSRSSNSDRYCCPDPESIEKTIGNLNITNLQESPRKLGGTHSDGLIENYKEKFCEFQKLSMYSPNSFPKRAPGFPKVLNF